MFFVVFFPIGSIIFLLHFDHLVSPGCLSYRRGGGQFQVQLDEWTPEDFGICEEVWYV